MSHRIWIAVTLMIGLAAAGCHRSWYREQADLEAYDLIAEKAAHPHWHLDNFVIDPKPESRMASFESIDCPPMPFDDPVANHLMHYVDHKKGYPFWDVNGHTMFVENPQWRAFLPLDEDGVLRLDSESAVKLALLHSPDYQTQLETLYLSALDVSGERFAFDPQHSAGYEVQYDAFGRLHPVGGGESQSIFEASTRNVQVRRLFTTGAELVAGFANSLIWQFSGSDNFTGTTLVNFSLVQPLLQGAGRDRIMESLTLAERTLLYGVRQMERYRRGFYLDIVMGNGFQAGPRRAGSALAGNFGAGGIGAGGVIGLLETRLSIGNQEANLDALRSSLTQLEALNRKGDVKPFQVDQTRSSVLQETSQLLNAKRAYRDRLDAFKRSLGLPPKLEVVIEDDMLDPVNLTDPRIRELQNRVKAVRARASRVNLDILEEFRRSERLTMTPELEDLLRKLRVALSDLDAVCSTVLEETVFEIRDEIEQLRETIPKRKQFAQKMRTIIQIAKDTGQDSLLLDVDLTMFNVEKLYGLRKKYDTGEQKEISLDELPQHLNDMLDKTVQNVSEIMEKTAVISQAVGRVLESGREMDPAELTQIVDMQIQKENPDQFNRAENNMIELLLISALARAESLMLPEVEITADEALEIARVFRRDWMNARASLVDSWRFIQFSADDLQSVLDIVFNGEIRNHGDNPLRLRDAAGALGVGVQFDAPLARLLERNNFRAALINYQAARRQYYQVDDEISQSLRSILRLIEFAQVNFEVQRTSLRVAVAQVRSSRLEIEKPPRPGAQTGLGPTASLDLINALGRLNRAQDAFIGVWVGYEVQRGLLDLQMGTMRLDEEGLWIDPGPIGPKLGYPSEEDLQSVPEYTHGFPSLDELLYRSQMGEPFDSEVVPTPIPDAGGSGEELELPLELGDLTQAPQRPRRRITTPGLIAERGRSAASGRSVETRASTESGRSAAVGRATTERVVQPATFSTPVIRGSEDAPEPIEANASERDDQSALNSAPNSRTLRDDTQTPRNPLRDEVFHGEAAVRAVGRKLRR